MARKRILEFRAGLRLAMREVECRVRVVMGEEQVQGAHSGPDTKDNYKARGVEEQGKAQLLTKKDMSARDNFNKGGMRLEMGEEQEQGARGSPNTKHKDLAGSRASAAGQDLFGKRSRMSS